LRRLRPGLRGFVNELRPRRRLDTPLVAASLAAILRLECRALCLAWFGGDLLAAPEQVLGAGALRAGLRGGENLVHLSLCPPLNALIHCKGRPPREHAASSPLTCGTIVDKIPNRG